MNPTGTENPVARTPKTPEAGRRPRSSCPPARAGGRAASPRWRPPPHHQDHGAQEDVHRDRSVRDAEADVAGGAVRCVGAAGVHAVAVAVRGVAEVRAAAHHTAVAGGGTPRVVRPGSRVVPGVEPVGDTTPRRCRSCGRGRSRWAGGVDRRGTDVAVGQVFSAGNAPWKTFMRCSPPGSSSAPHGERLPSRPPRAAYSHSASVGSRPPAHAQYAAASFHDTCTTGWSHRSSRPSAAPRGAASRRRTPAATTGRGRPPAWAGSRRAAGPRRRRTTRSAPRR